MQKNFMNIIAFSYSVEDLLFANIKKVLQKLEHSEFISSDMKTVKYKIHLSTRINKSFEDLRNAEAKLNTGDFHNKNTFGDIMSASNAEISAIEDPLLMTCEDNVLTIRKTTILDPDSTEFEMMFFYLQNHVIEFLKQLLDEQLDLNKVNVEINEEGIYG